VFPLSWTRPTYDVNPPLDENRQRSTALPDRATGTALATPRYTPIRSPDWRGKANGPPRSVGSPPPRRPLEPHPSCDNSVLIFQLPSVSLPSHPTRGCHQPGPPTLLTATAVVLRCGPGEHPAGARSEVGRKSLLTGSQLNFEVKPKGVHAVYRALGRADSRSGDFSVRLPFEGETAPRAGAGRIHAARSSGTPVADSKKPKRMTGDRPTGAPSKPGRPPPGAGRRSSSRRCPAPSPAHPAARRPGAPAPPAPGAADRTTHVTAARADGPSVVGSRRAW
jgi:hypothetical protein